MLKRKKTPLRFQQLEEAQGKTKTQIQTEKKKKREEAKIEKQKKLKVKNLEQSIADLEKNIEDLQQKLCLEEIYSDPVKSEEVNKELLDKETELEQLYEQWEEML